jgi:pimeloyl-ACP methyl ester carboxylesterase
VRFAILLAASCFLVGCATAPSTEGQRTVALTPCTLGQDALDAQCGTLQVYEDSRAGRGKQIPMHFAVLEATGRRPTADPLFMIAGGPGQAATIAFPPILTAFSRVNQSRDIVLVDQRGTGKSHPLQCPKNSEPAKCARSLGVDPALYTTPNAVDDLDHLRIALGYPKINLYGASYGSRVALVYLRQYPKSTRTLILDGVVPPNWNLGETAAEDAKIALDKILARCGRENTCKRAFPDTKAEFQVLSKTLDQKRTVPISDPRTGSITQIAISRESFTSTVRLLSYTTETAALLPLIIHRTYLTKSFDLIAAQSQLAIGEFGEGFSEGMYYSVVCAEDVPFSKSPNALAAICRGWPSKAIKADYKQAVTSNIPVLLLSGEADPVTPPRNAELAARTLPNSLQVTASGQGHIVAVRGCVPLLMQQFLNRGSTRDLKATCLQQSRPTPFFIDFAGPVP